VARESQKGDVLLVMSNGAFGGFIDKLLTALKARAGEG
jgi:UDP-N-acetylmuramate: L-alanyl-gamma-D-glutamyl-meso-diaminopimelate ligase